MKRQLIIGCFFVLPLSAAAGAKPKTTTPAIEPTNNIIVAPAPSGSRKVSMGDEEVVTIQTRPRHNTMLIFQDENVVSAGGGDTDPHRWVMESSSKTKQTHVFFVKPTRSGDDFTTDLNIVTSKDHSYSFQLVSCEKCAPDLKVFVSHREKPVALAVAAVDPHLAEIDDLTERAEKAEDGEKKALAEVAKTKTEAAETIVRERNEFQEKYPLSMKQDFVYPRNKQPFLVRAIWTDDTHTYIQIGGELSAIYTNVDGEPAVTLYKYERGPGVNDGTYVVSGVLNSGYLQLGKKSKLRFDRVKP